MTIRAFDHQFAGRISGSRSTLAEFSKKFNCPDSQKEANGCRGHADPEKKMSRTE
jgi:hypothetical protein